MDEKIQLDAEEEKHTGTFSTSKAARISCNLNESYTLSNDSSYHDAKSDVDTSEDLEFQTPSSVSAFMKRPSSTPMTNHKRFKTPDQKRKLFCNSNNSSPISSDRKYVPVSSPATSELIKLSDSQFLNSNLSIASHINSSLSTIDERICDENVSCSNDIKNSSDIVNNTNVSVDSTFNNSYVSLNFRSFDLLPGITPLNEPD